MYFFPSCSPASPGPRLWNCGCVVCALHSLMWLYRYTRDCLQSGYTTLSRGSSITSVPCATHIFIQLSLHMSSSKILTVRSATASETTK